MYAKARHPKKLVVLENRMHDDVYRGEGLEHTLQHTNALRSTYRRGDSSQVRRL
jgi:hypothetical protein